jgi:uncharacterized repeat protein (TIGR03803 family)
MTGKEKVLHSFGYQDGKYPNAGLTDVNGTLYGTTSSGGSGCLSYGCGTIYSVTTTGKEKVLYSFVAGSDGAAPYAGLIDVKGTLYGTTASGGGSEDGTVFSITTTGVEKVLHTFVGGTDGTQPWADLIDMKGTLYGTTQGGGLNGYGTVFSVTTTGNEKVLYSFAGGSDGKYPNAGLMNVKGTLYGTSLRGGGRGCLDHSGCGTGFAFTL